MHDQGHVSGFSIDKLRYRMIGGNPRSMKLRDTVQGLNGERKYNIGRDFGTRLWIPPAQGLTGERKYNIGRDFGTRLWIPRPQGLTDQPINDIVPPNDGPSIMLDESKKKDNSPNAKGSKPAKKVGMNAANTVWYDTIYHGGTLTSLPKGDPLEETAKLYDLNI
jgi:hypothetical protein